MARVFDEPHLPSRRVLWNGRNRSRRLSIECFREFCVMSIRKRGTHPIAGDSYAHQNQYVSPRQFEKSGPAADAEQK